MKPDCLTRRTFLLGSGASVVTIALSGLPGMSHAEGVLTARVAKYPRKKIASLRELKNDVPVYFDYPSAHPNCRNMLVKLGEEAAGGVGAEKDVVAFNLLCTHMGGNMEGLYRPEHKALGPCRSHLTTFDLRRHGMAASGHATTLLPQVLLEIEAGDVYAVGVMGLIYGFHDNASAL